MMKRRMKEEWISEVGPSYISCQSLAPVNNRDDHLNISIYSRWRSLQTFRRVRTSEQARKLQIKSSSQEVIATSHIYP